MVNQFIQSALVLGVLVRRCLAEELRYEILGTQPPPEPPPGWEGEGYTVD
jgi:hypothetical protein